MVDLDTRAAGFREQMIASLRRLGVVDEMVLSVLASVPRHRFVDRFWAVTPATIGKWDNTKEYEVAEDCSDEALALLYDPMTAVAIRRTDRAPCRHDQPLGSCDRRLDALRDGLAARLTSDGDRHR